jgi:hypothetical protein
MSAYDDLEAMAAQELKELRELNDGLKVLNARLEGENRKLLARVKELENYIRGLRIVSS